MIGILVFKSFSCIKISKSELKRKHIYVELMSLLILALMIAFLIVCITFFKSSTFKQIILPILSIYLFTAIAASLLERNVSNRILKATVPLYTFPLSIFYAVILLSFPFLTLLANWMLYFLLAYTLPYFLIGGLNRLHWIDFIRPQTITYFSITLTVFISVLLNQPLQFFVNLLTTQRHKNSKKLRPLELDKLTNYTLSINNVRFIVYSFYVIALIIINYATLQGYSMSANAEKDRILIQSFVTFIAFDRAFALMKQLDFRPSELLDKIVSSLKRKLESDQAELAQSNEQSSKYEKDA